MKRFADFLTLLLGFAMALVFSVVLLEIYFGKSRLYYVHEPSRSVEIQLSGEIFKGCPQKFRCSTNQQGMRGENYPDDAFSYRILAMGGSATICAFLNDAQTWPALVQNKLRRTGDGRPVWVGNIGKSGSTTRSHLLQARLFLPQYPIDAILLLVGINDLALQLLEGEKYDPHFMEKEENRRWQMFKTFDILPDCTIHPLYKRLGIWKLAQRTKRYYRARFSQNNGAAALKALQDYRRIGRQLIAMPDLSGGLEEYQRNLTDIIASAKQMNIRLIMVTQPTLWHQNMTKTEREALVFGFIGDPRVQPDHAYYSAEVLADGMNLYNQKLLQLCRQYNVECIDLAARLPRNLQMMYDDCHFTAAGAQLVADIVVDYLRTNYHLLTSNR